jgi:predicted AAA+ superfamily ATPase
VKAHTRLLEQLFLLYRLPAWSANLGARQVKSPKLLIADSGMAASLLGVGAERYSAPEQGVVAGALFETFVTMELVKQATWSLTPVELYFYRDTEKREVDLLIESPAGDVIGVECKLATRVDTADTRGLRLLRDRLGARFTVGVVVYCGENTLPLGERIWALPVSGLWQAR